MSKRGLGHPRRAGFRNSAQVASSPCSVAARIHASTRSALSARARRRARTTIAFEPLFPKTSNSILSRKPARKPRFMTPAAKSNALIGQVQRLIAERRWDGVIISGAPKEALNPGMWERVSAALDIPIRFGARSSVAALKAFAAKRILLMTPVDDQLKKMYDDYLAEFGIQSFYPPQILRAHTDAQKLTSSDVESMTHKALAEFPRHRCDLFSGRAARPNTSIGQARSRIEPAYRRQQSGHALADAVKARTALSDHRLRQAPGVVAGRAHGSFLISRERCATVRLAYRDHDRTPVIYCIKAMAERHYDVNVEILHIEEREAFEAALFDDRCDAIIEHFEYLHAVRRPGENQSRCFCAPQIHRGLQLVVPQDFNSLDELRGKTHGGARPRTPLRDHLVAQKDGLGKRRQNDDRRR